MQIAAAEETKTDQVPRRRSEVSIGNEAFGMQLAARFSSERLVTWNVEGSLLFHETATRRQKALLAAEMTLPSFVGCEGSKDEAELTGWDRNAKG